MRLSRPVEVAGLAAAYAILGWISLLLEGGPSLDQPFWAPLGLGLGLLTRRGRAAWPGLFLGALVFGWAFSVRPEMILGLAVSSTLAAWLAALVLDPRGTRQVELESRQELLRFGAAILVGAAVNVAFGIYAWGQGPRVAGPPLWPWVVGDVSRTLLWTPPLLWASRARWRRPDQRGWLGLGGSVVVTFLLAAGAFCTSGMRPLVFLTPLPLVWAALRFGPLAGAGVVLILAMLAAGGTSLGRGTFGELPGGEGLLWAGAFIGSAAALNLLIRALQAERSSVEERLHTAQGLQQALLDATDLALISTDVTGRIALFNQGAERLLGYAAADVVGIHTPLVFHEPADLRRRVERLAERLGRPQGLAPPEILAQVLERGLRDEGEAILVRKDGSTVNVWLALVALRDQNGRVAGSLGLASDLTERRAAEAHRLENQARWALYAEATDEAIWEWDLRTDRVIFSGAFERTFGHRPGPMAASEAWDQHIHPADRARVEAARTQAKDGAAPSLREEYRFRRADGSYAWVLDRAVIERDAAGRAIRMLGAILDQSQRKESELAVTESRTRLAGIIEGAHDGIITVDAEQRILVFNPAAEVIFRRRASEMLGQPLEILLPEVHRAAHAGLVRSFGERPSAARRMAAGRRIHGVRSDGTEVPLEASIAVSHREGAPVYTVVFRDLSQRLEAEVRQEQLEAQLRTAQKLEAIGTLAGGIAHDFNNILGAIMGNVELAQVELSPEDPTQEHLGQILQATLRARDLVQQILAFSRPVEGQRTVVDLKVLTEEVYRLLRSTLPSTVEFTLKVPSEPAWVHVDGSQLHQVIVNLCTNAFQALPDRRGKIELSITDPAGTPVTDGSTQGLGEGRYVRLAVVDNGAGIDSTDLERIFLPFFTTKAPGQGTGLGLAVAHGIVRAHGGAIRVQSRPGQGSTFEVLLPAHSEGARRTAPHPRTPTFVPRGQRVWLIDDEPALALAGSRLLQRLGYVVRSDLDPRGALGELDRDPAAVDVIVTDLTMPELSGLEFAERALKVRPDLPIILVTGFPGQLTEEEWLRHGVREVILKPYTKEAMAFALERALGRTHGH